MRMIIFCLSYWIVLHANPCLEQVTDLANKWQSVNNWIVHSENLSITRTTEFGRWISLYQNNEEITLSNQSQFKHIQVKFNPRDCSRSLIVLKSKERDNSDGLNDRDLKKIMDKNEKGIIYIWSPHMPLSILGIAEMEKAAYALGLNLTVVKDPFSNTTSISKQLKKTCTKVINSYELKMRNAFIHYPTIFLYHNGQLLNEVKYGFEKADRFEHEIKASFNNI